MKGVKYQLRGTKGETIILAEYCQACGGNRYIDVPGNENDQGEPDTCEALECGECDGYGFILTNSGSEILALFNDIVNASKRKGDIGSGGLL